LRQELECTTCWWSKTLLLMLLLSWNCSTENFNWNAFLRSADRDFFLRKQNLKRQVRFLDDAEFFLEFLHLNNSCLNWNFRVWILGDFLLLLSLLFSLYNATVFGFSKIIGSFSKVSRVVVVDVVVASHWIFLLLHWWVDLDDPSDVVAGPEVAAIEVV
jgi:hypothetical protein